MYKIRTIDVWDTLLRRDCHPECIKLATAYHLLFGWRDQLKPKFRDGWVLYKARLEAECTLAMQAKAGGKDDEYEITEVLRCWTNTVFSGAVAAGLPERLAEFELSVEVDRSYADHGILSFLVTYQAEKTLFLSDFYMSSEMLSRLLSAKGLDTLVSEGVSSCDVGLNKRSGKIYQHLHMLHAVLPHEHLHIGDNEWSDVTSPCALGINAIHYLPESAHAERLAREHLFSSREVLFDHLRSKCLTLAQNESRGLSSKHAAALNLGTQAAPLFIGFALWIAEQAVIQKLDRLYFFTREGEFFHKVFCALFSHGRLFGHDLPPADVLEVSRLSTFLPSMRDASFSEMSRIWSLFKVQSVSGLFTTLGVDIGRFSELLDTLSLKETDVITEPENSPELRRLFEASAFAEAVEKSLASQASKLQSYLKQCGVYECNRVGVVDIGWRGTIQDNISFLVPNAHFHGMYLGLRRFVNPQPPNVTKSAYGPDETLSYEFCDLFENFSVLELLSGSPNGSVVGYDGVGSEIMPQRQIIDEENYAFSSFTKYFQDGVLLAAHHWQSYFERYVVTGGELREAALHIWDSLRRKPSRDLAEVFIETPQHDVFGFGDIFKKNRLPSVTTMLLAPILEKRRRELFDFIRRVQWSAVATHARDVGFVQRRMLAATFYLANWFKRKRMKLRKYP